MLYLSFHQSFLLTVLMAISIIKMAAVIAEGDCITQGCPPIISDHLTYHTISFGGLGKHSEVPHQITCFPYGSEIIYACKDNMTNQFALGSINPYRKCSANGWLNINNKIEMYSPHCVPRKPHCRFPDINKGTFVVIDYQNYTHRLEINYSENTIAIYKCQDSEAKLTTGTEIARITCKKDGSAYRWNGIAPHCVMNPSTTQITTTTERPVVISSAQLTIEPRNAVLRKDQVTRVMCKSQTPIKTCLWEINGDLYNLQEAKFSYESIGILEDGECGIQANITEIENGIWTCSVFLAGPSRSPAIRATTNVIVLSLPQISLRPKDDPITVIAGETTQIDCLVTDARPAPAILWKLGDRELDNHQSVMEQRPNDKVSITNKLTYAFRADDHGKLLRCVTTGPWLNMGDAHEAFAGLNVIFPPQPKDEVTFYGFVLGQPGDITVNFTANPRPWNVFWKLDNKTELQVEPFTNSSNNFQVSKLKNTNDTSFEAKLRIKSVNESDIRRIFRLVVKLSMNGKPLDQEYVVRISTSPTAPIPCNRNDTNNCSNRPTVALSGGISAGVIAAVLIFTAVVLYARKTGRWCFARRNIDEGNLDNFRTKLLEGNVERINPDAPIEDQLDLLPYDTRYEFPVTDLVLGKQLGVGQFGRVVQAEAIGMGPGNSTVAVKMVKSQLDTTAVSSLASELKIMIHLGNHLNVVNLLGACTKDINKGELYVIVEFCRHGNLRDYLLSRREIFINDFADNSENDSPMSNMEGSVECIEMFSLAKNECFSHNSSSRICTHKLIEWAFQIACGMNYLTSRKVLHGDLAARNVLLADDDVVKVADFGLSRKTYENYDYQKQGEEALPVKWMAIESLVDRVFSSKSDVWSYGVTIWEIFSLGKKPYPQYCKLYDLIHSLESGYRMEKPEFAPKPIGDVMTRCWKRNPYDRITFPQLTEVLGEMVHSSTRQRFIDSPSARINSRQGISEIQISPDGYLMPN